MSQPGATDDQPRLSNERAAGLVEVDRPADSVSPQATSSASSISTIAHELPPPIPTPLVWSLVQRLLAIVACALLLPAVPVLFAAVKLGSRGPFLFPQKRRGLGGEIFTIYKIRTLRMDSERNTALGVDRHSATITRVGRILRQLKLDELPQLWNVIKGDMDLVGPRPIPVPLEDRLREVIPGFVERNRVKPGLTSFSQIIVVDNLLGQELANDWGERFQAELHYIHRKSVRYDIVVLVLSALYLARKFLRIVGIGRRAGPTRSAAAATEILGVEISNLDYDGFVDTIARWVERHEAHYVGAIPVHSVVEAALHDEHRAALDGASLNAPDGMPIVWAQRLLGHRAATRVYGPTLMLRVLERAEREGFTVGLYGTTPQRLDLLVGRLQAEFPALRIVCSISPPFRELTEDEDRALVEQIERAAPDILFIGLGCPKQERWMADHRERIRSVMLGVGAAFDFHAGAVPQAPALVQKLGMEWFFRLCCEPRRLFRRYATTNPIYVVLIALQLFRCWVLRWKYQRALPRNASLEPVGEA